MIRALPLLALALLCGCIQRVPRAHLATPAQIAVAYVVDPEHEGGEAAAPPELKAAIAAALSERNFNVVEVPAGPGTLSAQRMAAVEAAGLPYSLLVELRVTFFNQIDGRWRWDVATRLTAAQKGQPRAEDSFTAPAVLMFERQQGAEAIAFVAEPISQRVGTLLDGVVSAQLSRLDGGVATSGLEQEIRSNEDRRRDSIYFVMVDRFANGDPGNDRDADPADPAAFHGGDLAGLRKHLDWIQGLGFHTVWLSPVFAMRQTKFNGWGPYHGYWTYRLDQLEPRFGTEEELKALADDIHARGMRLFLDVVLNHAGHDAPLAQEHAPWFHHNGSIQDWNDKQQLEDREVHGLPDFDQDNEEAYQYLLQSSLKWARLTKADGFRLDAVKHAPARFWKRFATDVHQELGKGFVLLGEYLDSDVRQLAALQTDDGLDEVFDFPLAFAIDDVFCKRAPPSHLFAAISNDRLYRNPAGLVTLVDNHDLPRLASKCEGDPARFDQALQALFSARGTPSMIWDTEWRAAGAKDPDNRPDMKFGDAPAAGEIRKLLAERNGSPALYLGAPYLIEASEHVLAYLRVHRDQLALVVVNHSDKPWTPGSELTAAGFDAQPVPAGAFVTRVQPVASGKWADFATRVDHLWRTGTPKRQVRFTSKSGEAVCGSAPELGFWKPEAALKLSHGEVVVSLPVRSVVEYKLTRAGVDGKPQWEKGDNRTLVVNEGDGPLVVPLDWRGS